MDKIRYALNLDNDSSNNVIPGFNLLYSVYGILITEMTDFLLCYYFLFCIKTWFIINSCNISTGMCLYEDCC